MLSPVGLGTGCSCSVLTIPWALGRGLTMDVALVVPFCPPKGRTSLGTTMVWVSWKTVVFLLVWVGWKGDCVVKPPPGQ